MTAHSIDWPVVGWSLLAIGGALLWWWCSKPPLGAKPQPQSKWPPLFPEDSREDAPARKRDKHGRFVPARKVKQ